MVPDVMEEHVRQHDIERTIFKRQVKDRSLLKRYAGLELRIERLGVFNGRGG